MRVNFVKAISDVLVQDARSLFLTGDLGYNALEKVAAAIGDRFLYVGVAEQNMIGVAAGLALDGFRPWAYSIAPFLTYRAFEQIRNDVCLHNLPVRLVGNGGGFTYGIMGSTHHALEDLGVLKTLPNLALFFPATDDQVPAAVNLMQRSQSPAYLRLAISGFPSATAPLHEDPVTLTRRYSTGDEFTLIGVGHAVQIALQACQLDPKLAKGISVFSIARFPFCWERETELRESVRRSRRTLIIDEHYESGGMAESLRCAFGAEGDVRICAVHHAVDQKYGSAKFLLTQAGLAPEEILKRLRE